MRLSFAAFSLRIAGLLLSGWLCSAAVASPAVEADVCVYGATPGGIAAAVAAARSGSRVVLVEPTARVGGLVTSGLSHSDFHSFESLSGAFLELSQRVKAHYAETYGAESEQVKDCFEGTFAEPKVNLLALEAMLAGEATLETRRGLSLAGVRREGGRIEEASFAGEDGSALAVRAKVYVDGSYEGDLMAMAGVAYHVGREGRDAYGESLAPETGDGELQGYNFRFCATNDPGLRVPIAAPEGYRREDFLGVLPILESGGIDSVYGDPSRCVVKAHQPPLPNRKYDLNDVSRGLVRLSLPGHNLG